MELQKAITMLGVATDARFDIYGLAGARNAALRAKILTALTGVKTPQAKSGVHALREAFYGAAGITEQCYAGMESGFRDFCEGYCSASNDPIAIQLAATAESRRKTAEEFRQHWA